jgi:hypothetical protein
MPLLVLYQLAGNKQNKQLAVVLSVELCFALAGLR